MLCALPQNALETTLFIGQLAALGTAIGFSFGSTSFTLAGRQIGSALANRIRLLMALSMALVIHTIATGQPLPLDAEVNRWFWLTLSGLIGFGLGDAFLFQGFVMLGPRLAMLMMSLAPVLAVIEGWIFLDEVLSPQELTGIGLTLVGIIWVVMERGTVRSNIQPREYTFGLLFAFMGAVGQASGLVTAKLGLEGDFWAFSGNVIRLTAATFAIWAVAALRSQIVAGFRRLNGQSRALILMTFGTLAGPILGVWLSLVAVQLIPVGIGSTIMSLTPVFLIPISYVVFKERITSRMVVGTIIAFSGTALLFL